MPTFLADIPGTYTAGLVVTDLEGVPSDPDTVEISSENIPPTAVAGDDEVVQIGNLVVLDGLGSSDPDEDGLTLAWTITSAPAG